MLCRLKGPMRRQARKSCLRDRSTQTRAWEPSESPEDKQSCHWNKEEAVLFLQSQSQVGSEGIGQKIRMLRVDHGFECFQLIPAQTML